MRPFFEAMIIQETERKASDFLPKLPQRWTRLLTLKSSAFCTMRQTQA